MPSPRLFQSQRKVRSCFFSILFTSIKLGSLGEFEYFFFYCLPVVSSNTTDIYNRNAVQLVCLLIRQRDS